MLCGAARDVLNSRSTAWARFLDSGGRTVGVSALRSVEPKLQRRATKSVLTGAVRFGEGPTSTRGQAEKAVTCEYRLLKGAPKDRAHRPVRGSHGQWEPYVSRGMSWPSCSLDVRYPMS